MRASLLLTTCFCLGGHFATPATASAVRLFTIDEEVADPGALSPAAVRAALVHVDLGALSSAQSELELVGLDREHVGRARLDGFESRGDGELTWRGRIDGDHRVILTVHKNNLAGLIYTREGLYEVRPLAGARHALLQLEGELFPACAAESVGQPAAFGHTGRRYGPRAPIGVDDDPADRIDVLAVYTPQARDGAGGTDEIEATIQSAVDITNTGFIDSDMIARFRLVHAAEADYNDSGDIFDDLDWLETDSETAALRDQYAADLVGLITEDGGGFCGVAYVQRDPGPDFAPFAIQVTDRGCAVGNLTYAHEHGHNMGFEHDPANGADPEDASYPYAFGHFVDGSYRTIMSYSNQCSQGCTRVAHWSNPDVTHNGVDSGIDGERDNARAGDQTAAITANFRQGLSLTASGSCPGTVTLTISGASANGDVALASGDSEGGFELPGGVCAGTSLGIDDAIPVTITTADGNGEATLSGEAGAELCDQLVQVVDLGRCITSGVEELDALNRGR